MTRSRISVAARVVERVGNVLLAVGAFGAVVTAVAMAVVAVVARDRLGLALQTFLAAGETICVGAALRFLATVLTKRAAAAPRDHEERS